MSIRDLPALNALLNATSALLLLLGYSFIRKKRVDAHRRTMLAAFAVSALFFASYLTYHARVGSVRFAGTGAVRTLYLAILVSHSILAAAVPPLAIAVLVLALRDKRETHRRLARVTLPVWLYVCVTGIVVYVMLYRLYPPR